MFVGTLYFATQMIASPLCSTTGNNSNSDNLNAVLAKRHQVRATQVHTLEAGCFEHHACS